MFVGTDPEAFIEEIATGRVVPAHKLGYGDKQHKTPMTGGQVFRDGYALEFNVPASHCRALMGNNLVALYKATNKRLKATGHRLSTVPARDITLPDDLVDAPPDVQVFGCDRSWNAYAPKASAPALDARQHTKRYAGGHLHFSDSPQYYSNKWWLVPENQRLFIKWCDLRIGLPLTCLLHRPEQYERRKYYGRAGEYRPQKYSDSYSGIEYRVPGADIWNDYNIAAMALGVGRQIWQNFDVLKDKWDSSIERKLRRAINTGEGRFDLLVEVEGFYTPEIIHYMAEQFSFQKLDILKIGYELHAGWGEWAHVNLPQKLAKYVSITG